MRAEGADGAPVEAVRREEVVAEHRPHALAALDDVGGGRRPAVLRDPCEAPAGVAGQQPHEVEDVRAEDHQAFVREFIFEVKGGNYTIKDVVPKEKTIVPPACRFSS